jgi:hypothetical protein
MPSVRLHGSALKQFHVVITIVRAEGQRRRRLQERTLCLSISPALRDEGLLIHATESTNAGDADSWQEIAVKRPARETIVAGVGAIGDGLEKLAGLRAETTCDFDSKWNEAPPWGHLAARQVVLFPALGTFGCVAHAALRLRRPIEDHACVRCSQSNVEKF